MDYVARRALDDSDNNAPAATVMWEEQNRGRVSAQEAVASIAFLVYAGYATTAPLLVNAVYEAVSLGVLGRCVERSYAEQFAEEVLRLHTSVPQGARVVPRVPRTSSSSSGRVGGVSIRTTANRLCTSAAKSTD